MSGSKSPARKAAKANAHAPTPPGATGVRRVAAQGDSINWEKAKVSHSAVGDAFLKWLVDADPELSEKWGMVWDEVAEVHARDVDLHAVAAGYLCGVHPQAAGPNIGKLLHYSTAEAYWGGMVQTVYRRFSNSERKETKVRARTLPRPARATPPPP